MTRRGIILLLLALLALAAVAGAASWWWMQRGTVGGATAERAVEYYTCSMHPYLREPEPGNCPVCGMKLQPVYRDGGTGSADDGTIHVSAEESRLLGLRTVRVERRAADHRIRTVGRIEVNTERVHHVHSRMMGWVEKVHVGSLEVMVSAGQALLDIYAPEIVSTQEEYLLALRSVDALGEDADPFAREGAENLRDAARHRLRQWNVPEEVIAGVEHDRRVSRTFTLRSPVTGYVQRIQAVHGDQIDPASILYQIADIKEVWLIADIYEQDIPSVRVGQPVSATFAGIANRTFTGTITYIYPTIEASTRTNRVRISIPNPDHALKPGMFSELTIQVAGTGGSPDALMVPADAVLATGTRNIVFREHAPGIFEAVNVRLGTTTGGYYEILEGLKEGDTIVERGAFYLDSESQLRGLGTPGSSPHAGHGATSSPGATPSPGAASTNSITRPPSQPASAPTAAPTAAPVHDHSSH